MNKNNTFFIKHKNYKIKINYNLITKILIIHILILVIMIFRMIKQDNILE